MYASALGTRREQIFSHKAIEVGAVDHQCVPPGNLIAALEGHGSQQIRMTGTVNDPTAQIGQNLFGFLACDAGFLVAAA